MTFCSKEQKEDEIIEKVEYDNNFYTLYYLDGSESSFVNNDKEFLKKLETKIIKQALERNKIDCREIDINKWGNLIIGLASIKLTNLCLQKNLFTIACLGFVLSMYLIGKWKDNSRKLKELKKYKILLDNYDEFEKNPDISKLVEVDAFFRVPVNIFTIDEFSLRDIKIMQKKLKNMGY